MAFYFFLSVSSLGGQFYFYFRCDGSREKPKALRSAIHPRSCMPIMSPIMSQPLWAHTLCHSCFDLSLAYYRGDGLKGLPDKMHEILMPICKCSHSVYILEGSRILHFNFSSGKLSISLTFLFEYFWKTMSRDIHSLPRIHALCSFLFFSVVCVLFFHSFGCWSLFLWHENITNTRSEEERIRF